MQHVQLAFAPTFLESPFRTYGGVTYAPDAFKSSGKVFGPTSILALRNHTPYCSLPLHSNTSSPSPQSTPALSEDESSSSSEDESASEGSAPERHPFQVPPPSPTCYVSPVTPRIRCATAQPLPLPGPTRPKIVARAPLLKTTFAIKALLPPPQLARVTLPLPFQDAFVANRVNFTAAHGRGGVSLAEWVRLAEKRRTCLALSEADARTCVDEMFVGDERVLFQSYWPGYAPHTRYLNMPDVVVNGARPLTRLDLLDMVCSALADWVVMISNAGHIECREPAWTVGPKRIFFKDIYVAGIVEVEGYQSKWVPVLEVDARAL